MEMEKLSNKLTVLAVVLLFFMISLPFASFANENKVKIALNYPRTGPYYKQGIDQWRAAEMARIEINNSGGILGKKVEFKWYDSKSKVDVTIKNVTDAIDRKGVKMVFGGSASSVAVAAAKICQEKGIPFFGTLTYSTATTGKEGRRHTFRECYNAWMGAKAMASYLKSRFGGKKYFYITADYTWGWTTESSLRKFSDTEDKTTHKGILTPFPTAKKEEFSNALRLAEKERPDVLVLVLFGKDMSTAIRIATAMGLKNRMQIVVPNLTIGMAETSTPKAMEGVIGALPWTWQVPYKYNYPRGKAFVEKFVERYNRYPSTSGASAYTIMYEYKAAVERAGTFDSAAVIKALEGHEYQLLKDRQVWRTFDHQSVQTVYAVKCKPETLVLKDKYNQDYFEILSSLPGDTAVRTRAEWNAAREAAGKPTHLEKLPGE